MIDEWRDCTREENDLFRKLLVHEFEMGAHLIPPEGLRCSVLGIDFECHQLTKGDKRTTESFTVSAKGWAAKFGRLYEGSLRNTIFTVVSWDVEQFTKDMTVLKMHFHK